jgi:putative membrane protein
MQWWNSAWDSVMPWPMFLPMMLWPIVVIGGFVALVVLLLRGKRTETPLTWRRDGGRQTAFDILRERFARGEIDQQEFEERKGLLSQP